MCYLGNTEYANAQIIKTIYEFDVNGLSNNDASKPGLFKITVK